VQEYERAVIFRLGRLLVGGAWGPQHFFTFQWSLEKFKHASSNKWAPQFLCNSQLICVRVWASRDISVWSAAGGRSVGQQVLFKDLCKSSCGLIGNKWAPQFLCIIPNWSVQEYEPAVIFRLGRLLVRGARGPQHFFTFQWSVQKFKR
jgi:hypothetical protein